MAELSFRFLKNVCQTYDGLFRVDHSGGIVWIVYYHCLYIRSKRFLQVFRIRFKSICFIRPDHDRLCIIISGPVVIFHKVRCEDDLLVAGIVYRLHQRIDRRTGSYCHDNVIDRVICSESFVQIICNCLSRTYVPGIGHVAVDHMRIQIVVDMVYSVIHFFRRMESRISHTEIVNVFCAVYLSHLFAFFKHLSDFR